MISFISRRLLQAGLVLLALILILLVLNTLSPITPGRVALGPSASSSSVNAYNQKVGFNDPLPARYVNYVNDVVHGRFGESAKTKQPVGRELASRINVTFELAFYSLLLSCLLGLVLGLSSAWKTRTANIARFVISGLGSSPVFLTAFLLIILFGVKFHFLPISGLSNYPDYPQGPTGWILPDSIISGKFTYFFDSLLHLIMPVFTIALLPSVAIGRVLRGSMQAELKAGYVKTAETKGLSKSRIVFSHVLRNSMGPALSVTGLQFGLLISGVVIVEEIFGIPGIGDYLAQAIPNNDYPVVAAVTLVLGVTYVAINSIVDVIQIWIDPRISKPTK